MNSALCSSPITVQGLCCCDNTKFGRKFKWDIFDQPAYILVPASKDCRLFAKLKHILRGMSFESDDYLKTPVFILSSMN